jgi:RNA polymerase sigma factor (sigma-70 family)
LRLQSVTTPEDVFDSAFCQILKSRSFEKINDPSHLLNYFEQAAHRKAIQELRRLTKGTGGGVTTVPLNDDVEDHALTTMLDDLEQREELARIYSLLRPHERLLCTLRRGNHHWNEIAARMNTTPRAARQAFYRAMYRVKRLAERSAWPKRTPK